MKRVIALCLVFLMLALCACSGDSSSSTTTTPTEEKITKYSVGEVITANGVEFTLSRAEFAEGLSNTMDDTFMLPVANVTDSNPYAPDDGNVLISISYTIKNTGKVEYDIGGFNWTIDFVYGDGYTFSTDRLDRYSCCLDGEWTTLTTQRYIAPLSSKEYRAYIEVPVEVMENEEMPLEAIINLYLPTDNSENSDVSFGGTYLAKTEFTYTIR